MRDLKENEENLISGGESLETVACAVGGALLADAGPVGSAIGCIVAAALVTSDPPSGSTPADYGIGVTPLG